MISVTRTHEICAGHRVVGHEGKCKNLHGHNYQFEFTLESDELDGVGRVVDFSVVKTIFCNWLESNWDHKMLLWEQDPLVEFFNHYIHIALGRKDMSWIVPLPFNPTVENLAIYLGSVAPNILLYTGLRLVELRIWETSKCCATYKVKDDNANSVRIVSGSTGKKIQDNAESIQAA